MPRRKGMRECRNLKLAIFASARRHATQNGATGRQVRADPRARRAHTPNIREYPRWAQISQGFSNPEINVKKPEVKNASVIDESHDAEDWDDEHQGIKSKVHRA